MKKVLLTGATGFVGSELLDQLAQRANHRIAVATRSENTALETAYQVFNLGDFNSQTVWHEALLDVDCVVHTAGRAHVLKQESNALELFREANTHATLNLARQAAAQGVKRFVFISSIGVNGASTSTFPFSESSEPVPHADYATSKLEAEIGLLQIAEQSEMNVVIIRPPLVYAAHAPGNFRRLLKLVQSGIPLPFKRIKNSRSMVALENLVDFICVCIDHPAAANQIFLVSDGTDFSTGQLVSYLAEGMGHKALLFSIPSIFLKTFARLIGKQNTYTQLYGSLQIDSSKSRTLLGWAPPISADTAIINSGRIFMTLRQTDS